MNIANVVDALDQRIDKENEQNSYRTYFQWLEYKEDDSVEFMLCVEYIVMSGKIAVRGRNIIVSEYYSSKVESNTFNDIDSCIEFIINNVKTRYLDDLKKEAEKKSKTNDEFDKIMGTLKKDLDSYIPLVLKDIISKETKMEIINALKNNLGMCGMCIPNILKEVESKKTKAIKGPKKTNKKSKDKSHSIDKFDKIINNFKKKLDSYISSVLEDITLMKIEAIKTLKNNLGIGIPNMLKEIELKKTKAIKDFKKTSKKIKDKSHLIDEFDKIIDNLKKDLDSYVPYALEDIVSKVTGVIDTLKNNLEACIPNVSKEIELKKTKAIKNFKKTSKKIKDKSHLIDEFDKIADKSKNDFELHISSILEDATLTKTEAIDALKNNLERHIPDILKEVELNKTKIIEGLGKTNKKIKK